MQKKYLDQLYELYDEFHIVQTPLLDEEVRGTADLSHFSSLLFTENAKETISAEKS